MNDPEPDWQTITVCTACPPRDTGEIGDEHTCPTCGAEYRVEKTWRREDPPMLTANEVEIGAGQIPPSSNAHETEPAERYPWGDES